jgi:cytochrome c oxidase assembly protein Cox11
MHILRGAVDHEECTRVTLLLYCGYTVVMLLLYCCYTLVTLYSHFCYNISGGLSNTNSVQEFVETAVILETHFCVQ